MRNFKIKVYFKKDILIQPEIVLVRNDYNSTEFEFEFDVEEGKKIFELKKPDGTVFVKDIVDNKIILVDYDEESNIIPVINQPGEYNFEIVCYNENSKITASQKGKFYARDEVVNLDEDKISEDARLPILDSLINETIEASNNSKEQAGYAKEQGDYAKGQGNYAKDVASNIESKVTNGDFVGATFKPSVDKEGNLSWTNDKGLDNPSSSNIMGPQGPQGIQGIQGIQGPKGDKGDKPIKGVDYFTETDKNEMVSSITNDANSEFNINANEKLTEYNQNHEEKMQEYNSNAETKENEFNEEIETLKDELNDCYNNQLVRQAEGNSVYINDSADARLRSLEIDGTLKQETTKGNQLFDYQDIYRKDSHYSIEKDGWITFSYTNNTDSQAYPSFYTNVSNKLKTNTSYNVFLEVKSVSGDYKNNVHITSVNSFLPGQIKDDFAIIIGQLSANAIINKMITTVDDFENATNMLRTYITVYPGETCDITFRISVLEDKTITPENFVYEKFTGGQASPNPEYPQNIEALEAPNLFDFSKWLSNSFSTFHGTTEKLENGLKITSTDNDCYTNTYCNQTVYSDKFEKFGLEIESNQNYSLSFKRSNNNSGRVYVFFHDEKQNFISQIDTLNSSLTFKTPENAKYLTLRFGVSYANQTIIYSDIQLEKGTIVHSYSPFSCIKVEIDNKNLLFTDNRISGGTRNGIDYIWNGAKLVLNGTATKSFDLYNFGYWGNTDKNNKRFLKSGTYVFSCQEGNTLNRITANVYFEKTAIFSLWSKNENQKQVKTFSEDTYYSLFYVNIIENSTFNNETFYFQLEKGDIATDFESYQENSVNINLQGNFMVKLTDDIKDTLRIENGHAVLNKKIGKVILDGSESINKSYNNNYFSIVKDVPLSNRGSEIYPIKSNYYISDMFDKIYSAYVNYGIAFNYTKPRVAIRNKDILTVEEFKQWLSEHNVELYYELEEPYDVDLGTVKLPKIFKGVSNIFLNANLETNMKVEYVKDTQLVIDDLQSQINNINTLLSATNTSALLLDNLQSDLESEVI